MTSTKQTRWLVVTVVACLMMSARGSEEDIQARAVLAKYRQCIVTVQAVAELHMIADLGDKTKAAPDKDVPVTGLATIVQSDGLLVSAYSFFDPSSAFDGKTVNGPGGKKARLEVNVGAIKEVKFLMRDGTEVMGEVLLKDATLDLIVLRADPESWAKAGGKKLPSVDLDHGAEADLMDELVSIGLAGQTLSREVMVAHAGVMLKTTKPRLLYRPSYAMKGGPVFVLDGRLLGIAVQHVYRDKLVNETVIVPTADVADVVHQALAAPPPAAAVEQTSP